MAANVGSSGSVVPQLLELVCLKPLKYFIEWSCAKFLSITTEWFMIELLSEGFTIVMANFTCISIWFKRFYELELLGIGECSIGAIPVTGSLIVILVAPCLFICFKPNSIFLTGILLNSANSLYFFMFLNTIGLLFLWFT